MGTMALLPAAAEAKRIGSKAARGDYAVVVASGHANHPHSLRVRVTSRPHQHVSGNWTVVCSKGMGAGSKSGNFSGRTRLTRHVRMPYRHPSECTLSAAAQLDHGGKLRVTLLAY